MKTYINIDTKPNSDCSNFDFLVYTLYPPGIEPYALAWKDEDDDETETLICNIFGGAREMAGVIGANGKLPIEIEAICQTYGIVINKIGERLEEC